MWLWVLGCDCVCYARSFFFGSLFFLHWSFQICPKDKSSGNINHKKHNMYIDKNYASPHDLTIDTTYDLNDNTWYTLDKMGPDRNWKTAILLSISPLNSFNTHTCKWSVLNLSISTSEAKQINYWNTYKSCNIFRIVFGLVKTNGVKSK